MINSPSLDAGPMLARAVRSAAPLIYTGVLNHSVCPVRSQPEFAITRSPRGAVRYAAWPRRTCSVALRGRASPYRQLGGVCLGIRPTHMHDGVILPANDR